MKLSYRDRVLLLVALVILILVGGIFLLIKPKITSIQDHRTKEAQVQKEYDELQSKLNEIPKIQEDIKATHTKAVALAGDFIDLEKIDETYELDQMIQPLIDQNNVRLISEFQAEAPKAVPMEYYYFAPDVVTYAIYEHADMDGSIGTELLKKMEESMDLSSRSTQQVAGSSLTFTTVGEKEDIMNFLKDVKALNTSIMVTSVAIEDYTFNKDLAGVLEQLSILEKGESAVTFTIGFYAAQCVSPLDQADMS